MEPIPLCTRHVVATSVEDFALLDRAPEALVGALANSTKAFARMQDLGRALPVGMSLPCPPVPENLDMPKTERYIALCKEAFRPRMQDKAAFYYLRGAEDFRALRAAVLALTDMIVPRMGPAGFWCGFIIGLTSAAIMMMLRMRFLQRQPSSIILQRAAR